MHKLFVNFTYHSVGQGLFYSGKINDLNFVYDCGANLHRPSRHLIRSIDFYKETLGKKHIDLLILSHFDNDHINGLDYLLKDLSVNVAVIPYMSRAQRLVYAIYGDPRYYGYWENPVAYLREKKVEKIIVIGRGPEHTELLPLDYELSPLLKLSFKVYDKEKKFEDERDEWATYENVFVTTDIGTINAVNGLWEFHFFNAEPTPEELNAFNNALEEANIHNTPIEELVRNTDLREILDGCYNNFSSINNTSLVVYHGPVGELKGNCYISLENHMRYTKILLPPYNIFGQLLPGDIGLQIPRRIFNELINHFGSDLPKVEVSMLPHHGSIRSWNAAILEELPNNSIWISSARSNNWRNPHPDLERDIFLHGQRLERCHEFQRISIDGEIQIN